MFGPGGIAPPAVTVPNTCTSTSSAPTLTAEGAVQPVSWSPPAPAHEITDADGSASARSSNSPAVSCSGELAAVSVSFCPGAICSEAPVVPSVDTSMVTPPLVGTLAPAVASVSGSSRPVPPRGDR